MENLPDPQLTIRLDSDLNLLMTVPGIPGFNGYGAGNNAEEAFQNLLEDLYDYCDMWEEHFSAATNHSAARTVVSWVNNQANDRDIKAWLINSETPSL